MRKRWVLAVVLLLVVGSAFYFLPKRELQYDGRTLSDWFHEACLNTDEPKYAKVDTEEVRLAIQAMGTNAVPYLVEIARETRTDAKFRKLLHDLLKAIHLNDSYISSGTRSYVARKILRELKPPYAIVFPRLEADLRNPQRQNYGLWLLGCVGEGGEKGVPFLTAGLKDKDPWVRGLAVQSLAELGPKAQAAIPALIQSLQDKTVNSAVALGKIGLEASVALPQLESLLPTITNQNRCLLVARAICEIDEENVVARTALTNALTAVHDPKVQNHAQSYLGDLEQKARFAVPLLLQNANSTNYEIWHEALSALQKIDPASLQLVIPDLTNRLTNTLHCQDINAAAWLVRIDPKQPQGLDQLDRFIRARGVGIYSLSAVGYLAEAGCISEKAIAAVKFALSDPRSDVRDEAKKALRKLERKKAAETAK